MEEAPENGKESSHSAHGNGIKKSAFSQLPGLVVNVLICLILNTTFQRVLT
jgi:hypothetical protein